MSLFPRHAPVLQFRNRSDTVMVDQKKEFVDMNLHSFEPIFCRPCTQPSIHRSLETPRHRLLSCFPRVLDQVLYHPLERLPVPNLLVGPFRPEV